MSKETHPKKIKVIDSFETFAELYELTHRSKEDDLPLYLEFAREVGDPILEIGCGTGRVTFPLAESGHRVHGIDLSQSMLDIAHQKAGSYTEDVQQRVTFERQDMAELNVPGKQFHLVLMPYGEFAHVLERERQEATLEAIANHMMSGGILVIGMSNWDALEERMSYTGGQIAKMGSSMPLKYEGVFYDETNDRQIVRYLARGYDPSVQIAIHVYVHEITDLHGQFIAKKTNIVPIRYVFRYEMEHLLEKAGFKVEAIYGYYDRSPFCFDSKRMIFVARRV